MTDRLYDLNAYCRRFEATVVSCTPSDAGWAIVLDRTAFFPEGGGQAADTGYLNDISVKYVSITDGVITHFADGPLSMGEKVHGEINWDQRFRRMQKHTGEHIVSGLIFRRFGLDNVGFHLGSEDVTLDLNGELSRRQLDEIELEANAVVTANLPVTVRYPDPLELDTLEYRSKKVLTGPVRIVTVEGIDVCACCAPHVARTGEIGEIKLLDAIRYKGGTRIHMQCGPDAVKDHQMRYAVTSGVAALLSVRQDELVPAVERLLSRCDSMAQELRSARRDLAMTRLATIAPDSAPQYLVLEPLDSNTLRELTIAAAQKCGGRCVIFAGSDAEGYAYSAAGGDGLRELARHIGEVLHGKGGGSEELVQGRVAATRENIQTFLENLWLKERTES